MSKKLTAILVTCVLVAGFAVPLSACINANETEYKPQVTIVNGNARLSLTKVNGAKEYNIYHSPSRYGEYELVKTQKGLSFDYPDQYGYYRIDATDGEKVISSELLSFDIETFGDNMRIYSPDDDMEEIQKELDGVAGATGQFSTNRFSANFKAGDYSALDLTMRYYMTYSGLGDLPTDTKLGGFNVNAELKGGNATCNFWCGIENLSIDSDVKWAVSQATSFRRMYVNGNMALTQKGGTSPWGSGGFISNSVINGTIDAGAQQQWLTRSSKWNNWIEGDMNLCFVGCTAESPIPEKGINGISTVPVERAKVISEKPYLIFDGQYQVCVPEVEKDAKGVTWLGGENSQYVPLSEFYVARADRDTAKTINAALAQGKNIFFTPGIYSISEPLEVTNADTILIGNGLASLKPTVENTQTIMKVADVDGVRICGLMFDAGKHTESLLQLGDKVTGVSHEGNPTVLNDVYFRIGGAVVESTYVKQTLIINSDNVIGDNFWVWRADHSYGVAWEDGGTYTDRNGNEVERHGNVTQNGVIVNGKNVTIFGLMVEHFHEYQTIWNGENGYMVFYQSETPYDAPDQQSWMSHDGTKNGWASYKVADNVVNHTAIGLGVYHVGSPAILASAIEVPSNSGIRIEHMAIANFSSPDGAGIEHIINEYGKDVIRPFKYGQKTSWLSFVAGVATEK